MALINNFILFYISRQVSTDGFFIKFAVKGKMTETYDTDVAMMKDIYATEAGICTCQGYEDNFLTVLLSCTAGKMKEINKPMNPATYDLSLSANLLGNN